MIPISSLKYAGKAPSGTTDTERRLPFETALGGVLQHSYVDNKVATSVAPLATTSYVDAQDNGFIAPSYYQTQDGLLIPNAQKAAANGVASLDASTKIPVAQVPVIGDGIIRGPYGITSTVTTPSTTGSTPVKICTWTIANPGFKFWPLVFMSVFCNGSSSGSAAQEGKAIIEVCNGSTYSTSTVVAGGYGPSFYGYRGFAVMPGVYNVATSFTAAAITLTAWLYSPYSDNTVSTDTGFLGGSVWLLRIT